jgi:hypothetical protein
MPPPSLAVLPREARLVLLTSAGPTSDSDAEIRRLLSDDVEWTRVFGIALQQRATMPVWRRLSAVAADMIPDPVAGPLRRSAMVASFQQLHLRDRLVEVLRTLDGMGIRVLVLKGAALALTVYRSFEDRPMGDIDLLVDPEHAVRAQDALVQLGWQTTSDEVLDEFYREHQHLPALRDPSGTGVQVEVHTELFFQGHPFAFPVAALWRDSRRVPFASAVATVPSADHVLLHLCLHFAWSHMAQHGAWRTFRDLHAIAAAGDIDWDAFCRTARETRGVTACYWTLRLAAELTGFAVPADVLRRLAPPGTEALRALLARHFAMAVVPLSNVGCPSARMSKWMWEAALRPRWSGHGAVRPWMREEVARNAFLKGEAVRGVAKVRGQLRLLGTWRQYLGALLPTTAPIRR